MYETKFLLGVLAGALSPQNDLGYIADYPIFSTISNINAFALGAQMVNPKARVHLAWNCLKNQLSVDEQLSPNITFISDKDFIVPEHPGRHFGLYEKTPDEIKSVATTICHWGKFYEKIIESVQNDAWKSDDTDNKNRAINYWWGMSSGVTELICSHNLPPETAKLIDLLTRSIKEDLFHPFDGLLIDQNGIVRQKTAHEMTPAEIVTMDWLVENVVGNLPDNENLNNEARQLVALQGDPQLS